LKRKEVITAIKISTNPIYSTGWSPSLGAWPEDNGIRFRIWAPRAAVIEAVVERRGEKTKKEWKSKRKLIKRKERRKRGETEMKKERK